MKNPLLDFQSLPLFDQIKPEHVTPAISQLLEKANEVISSIENQKEKATWDNFIEPLDTVTEKLSRAWGFVGHLHSVLDTPELREAYNENLPKITSFWTKLSQNLILFQKYQEIYKNTDFKNYSKARQKIITDALRDFKLGGAELPEDQKKIFADVQEKLAALSTKFSENVLDATNAYALYVEKASDLEGLPEDALLRAQHAAKADQKEGFKFTLHFPSYFPFMQFVKNSELRKTFYKAYVTKASELGENKDWDNTPHIDEILKLREQEAHLLGYKNFAEVSLVSKMAESPQSVISFLEDLAKRARPFAEKDIQELKTFAKNELNLSDLQAWDLSYASEKLREKQYSFSEQEVKRYFPLPRVLDGLFKLAQNLFNITISKDIAPTWHPDVTFFKIERDGQLIGQFYMDLFARQAKQGGAWMNDAISRRKLNSNLQRPLAYLVCNFTPPLDNKPSYLRHDEVITLFHEFGHGLHHLLTQMEDLGVSGISGVEWDAVELPSQFMENFCWEWSVLSLMTEHEETKAPLPRELFDKMIAAKNFQSGLMTLRQIEFALTDMHLHFDFMPKGSQSPNDLLNDIRKRFAVTIPPAFNRFLNAFSHIFAGGYAAGYYSYKWAEVLSSDVYSAFEEAFQKEGTKAWSRVGQKLLDCLLSQGGSRPAMELFEAFRGRKPTIDALLRHNGLI